MNIFFHFFFISLATFFMISNRIFSFTFSHFTDQSKFSFSCCFFFLSPVAHKIRELQRVIMTVAVFIFKRMQSDLCPRLFYVLLNKVNSTRSVIKNYFYIVFLLQLIFFLFTFFLCEKSADYKPSPNATKSQLKSSLQS